MIHTRVRSFSDNSVEPTHGFGFLLPRSTSAAISAGHSDFSFFSACLSSMVGAIEIPPKLLAVMYRIMGWPKRSGRNVARGSRAACNYYRWLNERPAERPFAAAGRLGSGYLRTGRDRTLGPRRRDCRAAGTHRAAARAWPRDGGARRS